MTDPLFRLVCAPGTLTSSPAGWAVEMLRDGEVAVTVDEGGLAAVDAAARTLALTAIPVIRGETTPEEQELTIRSHADALALIWIAPSFSDDARQWAEKRGPMTLLVSVDGELPEAERRKVERFVSILSGQAA